MYGSSFGGYGNVAGGYGRVPDSYHSSPTPYSPIERIAMTAGGGYKSSRHYGGSYLNHSRAYEFKAELFLNADRPAVEFGADIAKLMPFIEYAFYKTTGEQFPDDIQISLVDELGRDAMGETFGLSFNNFGRGRSRILVKKDFIDRMMLTIGHEIGHVMSETLPDGRDEEAKAFAFSLEWMNMIVRHNILGLNRSINPQPARNGLHNVAFEFVVEMLEAGRKAMQVFQELIMGALSVSSRIEKIIIKEA